MMLVSKQYGFRIYTACSCEKDDVMTTDLINSIDTTTKPTLTIKAVDRGMNCILYIISKRNSAKPSKAIGICRHFPQACMKSLMLQGWKYLILYSLNYQFASFLLCFSVSFFCVFPVFLPSV